MTVAQFPRTRTSRFRSLLSVRRAACAAAMVALGGLLGGALLASSSGCSRAKGEKQPKVAFVTNGPFSFWNIAERGAKDAAKEFGVDVEIKFPDPSERQKQEIDDLLIRQVAGIAVSPIDAVNQASYLKSVGEKCFLVTHDSDSPGSDRRAYVGMDNYEAGRMCGKLVKEAMPEGGSVMIFIGRLEQANARLRRQGVIDELLDRPSDAKNDDPPGAAFVGDEYKYQILGTQVDGGNQGNSKTQAEAVIARYPEIGCMVGLFAYNPPAIIEALRANEKLGQVKVVAFDEDDGTLAAIQNGNCYGTIVQNPYGYGYESIKILAGLIKGDESVLPKDGVHMFPPRRVTKENVDEFWEEIKGYLEEK